jgi:magnesium-transporting ATPase (P-type)
MRDKPRSYPYSQHPYNNYPPSAPSGNRINDKRLGLVIIIGLIFTFITMSFLGYSIASAMQDAEEEMHFSRGAGYMIILFIIWNIIFWIVLIYVATKVDLKSKSNIVYCIGLFFIVSIPIPVAIMAIIRRGYPLYSYGLLLFILGILAIIFYKIDAKDYDKKNYENVTKVPL